MNCEICLEHFDHSIHKPYSLMSCPHTYCLRCIKQLNSNTCPACNKAFFEKNPNMALLQLIPESSYDKLKAEVLREFINLNEIKQDLNNIHQVKLNTHAAKLALIKQTISDRTNKMVHILRQNENILKEECDKMYNWIESYLDLTNYEDNKLFQINVSKDKIEKDSFNEIELTALNILIPQLKQKLNELTDQIQNYENKYEFITNDNLLPSIGQMKTVINKINYFFKLNFNLF